MDSKKLRLNLEITSEVREQLEALQKQTGAASLTEVIRRALALYNCISDYTQSGWELVLQKPKTKETKTIQLI
jgi:methionyl-tRNA synthetase